VPAATPPRDIQVAYTQAVRSITRRVEIYEADGVTPWVSALKIPPFVTVDGDSIPGDSDMVEGNVSVDFTRAERRTLEVTFDNRDGTYSTDPSGFWYDKIIKVYRGIRIPSVGVTPPAIMVIEDQNGTNFSTLVNVLRQAGFYNIRYKTTNVTLADLTGIDIVIAMSNSVTPSTYSILNAAFAKGVISIFTFGTNATQAHYPYIMSTTTAVTSGVVAAMTKSYTTMQSDLNSPVFSTLSPSAFTAAGYLPATVPAGVKVATIDGSVTTRITSLSYYYIGRKWFHIQQWDLNSITSTPGGLDFVLRGLNWLNPRPATITAPVTGWELQVGEFMIDSIEEKRFPRQVVVQGRDYTKKLLNAKFGATTNFPKTDYVETTIQTIAINGGIKSNKIIIPGTRKILGTIQSFERGTARWDAITKLAEAFNLEVFFDNVGNLVVRPFLDPTTSYPIFFFSSGADTTATLTDFDFTSSDSSMVNQVIVCGESSDKTVIPVSAQANNTNPNSPSNQSRLGIRTYYYHSPAITTTTQAQNLANRFLSIYALEEFNMTWGSLCIDWLEAGDIVDVSPAQADYRMANSTTSTRYLLSSFEIPLGLGPMSAVGKRVLVV